MIADFDTCEWDRPGGNPSMVTIEQAVARAVPLADRAELLRQFNDKASKRFDIVRIKRATIISTSGAAQYAGLVSNMNFGSGGLCYTVTRNTWTADDEQWAMVFKVNGRFYGYAAICRNLFSLYGRDIAPPPPAPPTSTGLTTTPETPEAPPVAERQPEAPPATFCECEGGSWFYGGPIFVGGPAAVFVSSPPQVPNIPTPVPEPEIYALYLAGIAALAAVSRRGRA